VPRRVAAVAAALLAFAQPASALAAGISPSEAAILRDLNRVRVQHGLRALRLDRRLERAARAHTREMLATGRFRHGAFVARLHRFDVWAQFTGENLAWGAAPDGTASWIVSAWLASPEHRANLLRPSYTLIGIADLVGAFLGLDGAHVVTADFAG
jgi:uncharacterized protein YkwD